MILINNFRKVSIGTIFDFPETNSKITKKFCNQHRGEIPVYASSKSETSMLGFIKNNIPGVKYYENCLSWNRNGSVGYVFLRNHRFATNEDHRAMVIKSEYRESLSKIYLKFEIERQLLLNGFSYLDKCGVGKIQEVSIYIPIHTNGKFNKAEQIKLANQYTSVKKIKNELAEIFEKVDDINISIPAAESVVSIELDQLFSLKKGSSKYTQKYLHNNHGPYPVYSSQTLKLGEFGKIDTYDYEEECFTWTTDGIYAGTVFYRNGKFSVTTHCGVMLIKSKYNNLLDFSYLKFKLNEILPNSTLGEGANRRLGIERMKELSIDIPITDTGVLDLAKQKQIAQQYEKIYNIKSKLQIDYQHIIDSTVSIIDESLISIV